MVPRRHVANQLLVHEFLDSHVAKLAPVTGVLDAAKRQFSIRPADVVDEHHSGIDAARHPLAAREIPGEDGAPQAEVGVVGERDGGVFILDAEEHGNRAKKFVSKGRIIRLDVRQYRRLHESPGPVNPLAAQQHLRTVSDRNIDLFQKIDQGGFR